MLMMGLQRSTPADDVTRYLWLAELGYELAQYNAAYIIQNHHAEIEAAGVFVGAKPLEIALLLLQRSADQEHVDSVVQVADVLYGGILAAEDQAEAFRLYRVAGQAGSARALFNIGWAHQSGDGLPLDLEIAKRYYDMALATEQEAGDNSAPPPPRCAQGPCSRTVWTKPHCCFYWVC